MMNAPFRMTEISNVFYVLLLLPGNNGRARTKINISRYSRFRRFCSRFGGKNSRFDGLREFLRKRLDSRPFSRAIESSFGKIEKIPGYFPVKREFGRRSGFPAG